MHALDRVVQRGGGIQQELPAHRDLRAFLQAIGDFDEVVAAVKKAGVAVLGWGQFVTVLINFLILAWIIFLLVRTANRITHPKDQVAGPSEVDLLTEIRDELKRR